VGGVGVVRLCPRCGLPFSYLERHVVGGRVYFYAVHYYGRDECGRKRVRKCYLGPVFYVYGSKTHEREGLILRGLIDSERILNYLDAIINYFKRSSLDERLKRKVIGKLKEALRILEEK